MRGMASATVDVSDGLVADLAHICAASGGTATIDSGLVPLSPAGRRQIDGRPELLERLVVGGDDYELLFTVPPDRQKAVAAVADKLDLPLTRIGTIDAEPRADGVPVTVLGPDGVPWLVGAGGYRHF